MDKFYQFDQSDFEEIRASQLRTGDLLSLPNGIAHYGAAEVDEVVFSGEYIIATYQVPIGANVRSSENAEIQITWNEGIPCITIVQTFTQDAYILILKVGKR